MSNNRYQLFRNYMVNELGISRDDIMQWTREAIQEQVQKLVGQMNVEQIIMQNAKLSSYEFSLIREAIAKELAKNITVGFKKDN